jgi:hypothetical protein
MTTGTKLLREHYKLGERDTLIRENVEIAAAIDAALLEQRQKCADAAQRLLEQARPYHDRELRNAILAAGVEPVGPFGEKCKCGWKRESYGWQACEHRLGSWMNPPPHCPGCGEKRVTS